MKSSSRESASTKGSAAIDTKASSKSFSKVGGDVVSQGVSRSSIAQSKPETFKEETLGVEIWSSKSGSPLKTLGVCTVCAGACSTKGVSWSCTCGKESNCTAEGETVSVQKGGSHSSSRRTHLPWLDEVTDMALIAFLRARPSMKKQIRCTNASERWVLHCSR